MALQDADPVPEHVAREWTHSVLIRTGRGSSVLHLVGRPPNLEGERPRADGGEGVEDRTLCGYHPNVEFRRKQVEVYPPGHHEICEPCGRRLGKRLK